MYSTLLMIYMMKGFWDLILLYLKIINYGSISAEQGNVAIGNNINQIARKINQGKILEGVEKEKFSEELEKVQTAQNKIYDKLEKIMRWKNVSN